jgi:hypothetical protein
MCCALSTWIPGVPSGSRTRIAGLKVRLPDRWQMGTCDVVAPPAGVEPALSRLEDGRSLRETRANRWTRGGGTRGCLRPCPPLRVRVGAQKSNLRSGREAHQSRPRGALVFKESTRPSSGSRARTCMSGFKGRRPAVERSRKERCEREESNLQCQRRTGYGRRGSPRAQRPRNTRMSLARPAPNAGCTTRKAKRPPGLPGRPLGSASIEGLLRTAWGPSFAGRGRTHRVPLVLARGDRFLADGDSAG